LPAAWPTSTVATAAAAASQPASQQLQQQQYRWARTLVAVVVFVLLVQIGSPGWPIDLVGGREARPRRNNCVSPIHLVDASFEPLAAAAFRAGKALYNTRRGRSNRTHTRAASGWLQLAVPLPLPVALALARTLQPQLRLPAA